MSKQLHGTSRRLPQDPEAHKQQCVAEVASRNLVSPLRFISDRNLTLGFLTKNRDDAARVVEQFLSFEKKVPYPGALIGDIIQKIEENNGNLLYEIPLELALRSEMALSCPSVRIQQRANDLYSVCFGDGFTAPGLCAQVPHQQIPVRRLDFSMLHIPNTHGTKAFSEIAAARALADHLENAEPSRDNDPVPGLVLGYRGERCTVTIMFRCPAPAAKVHETEKGLLIIPVSSIPTSDHFREKVSVLFSLEPRTSYPTDSEVVSNNEILGEVSGILQSLMAHLFGEQSSKRLRSVADLLD
jgi:hypothetical protein